jgi:hypothetical protein
MTKKKKSNSLRKKLRKILPDWVNFQNFIFVTVILAFMIIVLWSETISKSFGSDALPEGFTTSTPTILPGTPTPVPAELLTSAEQTNGILFGAIIILFTILVGTSVMVLRDYSKEQ